MQINNFEKILGRETNKYVTGSFLGEGEMKKEKKGSKRITLQDTTHGD
jgi:hypothetical protein